MKARDAARFIGSVAHDEFGAPIGQIIGFTSDVAGNIISLIIGRGDYYEEYPLSLIKVRDGGIIVSSHLFLNFSKVERTLTSAFKRINALEKLREKGETSEIIYERVASRFKVEYDRIKENAESLINELQRRLEYLENMRNRLEESLLIVKVSIEIGDLGLEKGQKSVKELENLLKRINAEIVKVSQLISKLRTIMENPDTGENPDIVKVKVF